MRPFEWDLLSWRSLWRLKMAVDQYRADMRKGTDG